MQIRPNSLKWLVLPFSPEGLAANTTESLHKCVSLRCETFVSSDMFLDNCFLSSSHLLQLLPFLQPSLQNGIACSHQRLSKSNELPFRPQIRPMLLWDGLFRCLDSVRDIRDPLNQEHIETFRFHLGGRILAVSGNDDEF